MLSMHDWKKFDTMERVKKNRVMAFVSGVTTWSSKRTILLVAVVVASLVGSIVTSQVHADTIQRAEGERLITLYDRGVEQSFITTAATVGGALMEAGIDIDDRDRVEPALDERLVATEYSVNVYRARPLVVIDGASRKKIMTASQSPEQIAKDAKITLYPEDIAATRQSSDLLTDGASEQFVITRATVFSFTLYGELIEARTQAHTVGEMLKEKQITLGVNDRASLPLSTPVTPGLELRVWREGKQTQTVEEEVAFDVEEIRDANLPSGHREVRTPGIKGLRTATYEIIIKDGQESSRTEIASVVKKQPVKQIEIIGTKVPPITGTCGEWMAAAGITHPDAHFLIGRESGCNPRAVNRGSGACGIPQALPCSKMGPVNADGTSGASPEAQLRWMNSYVYGRYGSWENARIFWERNHWY